MRYISIVIFLLFFCAWSYAQDAALLKKANRGDANACIDIAQMKSDSYHFEEAGEWLEKAQTALKKKKQTSDRIEPLENYVKTGDRLMHGVDKIAVIDSFVVEKSKFLSAYKISSEIGLLDTFRHYFGGDSEGTVYVNEMGTRSIFAASPRGERKLFGTDKLGGKWSEAVELNGTGLDGSEEDYPFVTLDGSTMYFASKGHTEGLGGYDIYVTRVGSDANTFLKPESMGMPYNSPYNDYMLVIDEVNNLGWFASDRYQDESHVCIYVFIPKSSRESYDYDETDIDELASLASLKAIRQTLKQANPSDVASARQRLAAAIAYKPAVKLEKEFTLVIDDSRTYTSYSQFKNSKAESLCREWVKNSGELEYLRNSLDSKRKSYEDGDKSQAMSIRQMEKNYESLLDEVAKLEKNVRNLELK